MTHSILLSENTYQLQNALCWGNCAAHWQAYRDENEWSCYAVAHLTLVLSETLPFISQIVSLFEMCLAWIYYSCCAAETSPTATTPTTPAPSTSNSRAQSSEQRRSGQPPHGGPGQPPPSDGPSQSRPAPSSSSAPSSSAPAPSSNRAAATAPLSASAPAPASTTPAVASQPVPGATTTAFSPLVPGATTNASFFPSTPLTPQNLNFEESGRTGTAAGLYVHTSWSSLMLCELTLSEEENVLFICDNAMARPGMETPFQVALEWAIHRRRNQHPLRVIMATTNSQPLPPNYSVAHLNSLGLIPYTPTREELERANATMGDQSFTKSTLHLHLSPEAAHRWNTQILTNPLLPETQREIQPEFAAFQNAQRLIPSDTNLDHDVTSIILGQIFSPILFSSQPSAPPAAPETSSTPAAPPTPPATTAAASSAPTVQGA